MPQVASDGRSKCRQRPSHRRLIGNDAKRDDDPKAILRSSTKIPTAAFKVASEGAGKVQLKTAQEEARLHVPILRAKIAKTSGLCRLFLYRMFGWR